MRILLFSWSSSGDDLGLCLLVVSDGLGFGVGKVGNTLGHLSR